MLCRLRAEPCSRLKLLTWPHQLPAYDTRLIFQNTHQGLRYLRHKACQGHTGWLLMGKVGFCLLLPPLPWWVARAQHPSATMVSYCCIACEQPRGFCCASCHIGLHSGFVFLGLSHWSTVMNFDSSHHASCSDAVFMLLNKCCVWCSFCLPSSSPIACSIDRQLLMLQSTVTPTSRVASTCLS